MKILLDENLDHRLRRNLGSHDVFTASYIGWSGLKNGKLLEAAEREGFDLLIIGDQSLRYEQNLTGRRLAIIAVSSVEWRMIKNHLDDVMAAIDKAVPGSFQEIQCGSFNRKKPRRRLNIDASANAGVPMSTTRPPLPPFTHETAAQKVRLAEDAWNSRDPVRVSLAYTEDSRWRNRSEFFTGRAAIVEFLTRKWAAESGYRLIKELWAFTGNRISVRFQYEWHDTAGQWFRAHGNEQWEFTDAGLMARREASINDVPIAESERKFLWPDGPRPADYPGLTELGL